MAQKKSRDEPALIRQSWIDPGDELPIVAQCSLSGISKSAHYARQKSRPANKEDLLFSRLIDEEYTRRPFYGSRRMVYVLKKNGHAVGRKRVQRLMREMGLAGMMPGPNTSRRKPGHKIYPYLLRGVPIVRPNQVWSIDITYIRP
ncbi:IS3 family transposase [Desulfobotulus mexicanus]|uniref:IS3 family transposase n=1 Tax=Desulfobotulus mexicanus TaxID=2586642 RepID=A0A5S5MBM3_9BACT|nr:IS3 family transposase [Desulfobotulus mexicanus]